MKIMELVEKDIKARDIITEASIRNAVACDMALGCSSNSCLLYTSHAAPVPARSFVIYFVMKWLT